MVSGQMYNTDMFDFIPAHKKIIQMNFTLEIKWLSNKIKKGMA